MSVHILTVKISQLARMNFCSYRKNKYGINKVLLLLNEHEDPSFLFQNLSYYNTSSNQRLWECVRCRTNVYPDTLNDFPSWLSTSKNQPCFVNNRGFTERYFSDKVHASLMDWWLRCVTAPVSVDSHVYYDQNIYISFSNFVLNIITLTCNV